MHGILIFSHFRDSDFWLKIEKCNQFVEMVRFWTVASKIPPSVRAPLSWPTPMVPFSNFE